MATGIGEHWNIENLNYYFQQTFNFKIQFVYF